MALTTDDIRGAAEKLHQAEKTRRQIRQLSLQHPGITIADAYAIQKAWIEIKLAEGRIVRGHKIGLTSKAMQSALGIDEPDSGVLLDDMFFRRWRPGAIGPLHRHAGRGRTGVHHEATAGRAELHDVRRAQRHGFRGARAGNSRHQDRAGRSRDQIDAENLRYDRRQRRQCRHRARRPSAAPAGCRPALDRRTVPSQRPIGRNRAWPPACSIIPRPAWRGSPTRSPRLALEPGQVVLAGSFIRPIETRKGDTIQADYGPYGTVSCYFA
jgi:2-oxo-hept-3-ene-1,7-dioate hydratase